MTELEMIRRSIERYPDDPRVYRDALAILYDEIQHGRKELHADNKEMRKAINAAMRRGIGDLDTLNDIYWKSMLVDATVDFDSFMLYLEKNRKPDDKFYVPRRKVLAPIVNAFQEVQDGKLDFLSTSQPKRTGKTTVGTWFVLFRGGQSPNGRSLCVGAGDALVGSFYRGMLEVLQQPEKYAFYEIFPDAKLVETKADEKTFNLKEKARFSTVTCRPIDGQITGSTEATPDGVIYLDDCVRNEEEAVNTDRLEFLWDKIRGDVLGRRLEGCPIVAQGTRYSLRDPQGKLQDIAPEMGWRYKILEIPALNDNDESNFEITLHGKKMFTSAYYQHERLLVTPMQWESQFQQHPYEAKGQLFPEGSLNRFFELPLESPDAIIAACDTADKGSDSVSMPIGYVYGEDVYIPDVVFNNGTPEYTKPECAIKLTKHVVQKAQFETNNAGEYYAVDVEKLMKQYGGKTSITLKRTIANKSARIEAESDRILKHFYFLDRSKYTPGSEYWAYIKELCAYVRTGKVSHDDAPDGTAMLSELTRRISVPKAKVVGRPF